MNNNIQAPKPSTTSLPHLLLLSLLLLLLLLTLLHRLLRSHRPVYLLDYACLTPPKHLRVPHSTFKEHLHLIGCFDKDSIDFMSRVFTSSGLGQETCFPPSLHYIPPKTDMSETVKEAEMLLFPVLEDLFFKTKVDPREVDVLVVNCSGFCPAPSLTSMVVNKFKMREDVKTFALSGMGCSAGMIGVELVGGVMKAREECVGVVVSCETLSTGWYAGKDRRKLLLNCVFRMGSAAVLLTNRRHARIKGKYKLLHLIRTNRAADDAAYRSAIREEDSENLTGFSVHRNLLHIARDVLRCNITTLATKLLPFHVQLRYLLHLLLTSSSKSSPDFVPNFSSYVHHFCIPSSGLAVIKEVGRGLGLKERELEAAVETLRRFGNQSASSMWYQLAYVEAKGRVGKGEMVWQLGMGSGPKCNTAVWECLRDVGEEEGRSGPWFGHHSLAEDQEED